MMVEKQIYELSGTAPLKSVSLVYEFSSEDFTAEATRLTLKFYNIKLYLTDEKETKMAQ